MKVRPVSYPEILLLLVFFCIGILLTSPAEAHPVLGEREGEIPSRHLTHEKKSIQDS